VTAQEIKAAAENYIDEAIDDDEAVTAINAALSKIGDIALIYDTVVITDAVGRTWLALPQTTTYVVEVVDADGNVYDGWRVRDNRIWFADPGTYTVHYRRLPNPISGILDTPEVHQAYHQCLVTYLIGWWKLKDDDESPDGLRNMQQFEADVMRVFNTLRRKRGPMTVTVVR
jgi:hypothetical protein